MNKMYIDKLVLIVIRDHRVTVALGKGQSNWHIPTTQHQGSETDIEALARLAKTDLSADLRPETVRHFQTFEVHAHAHGMNPEKTDKEEVRLKCYLGELKSAPTAGAGIEKVDFFWFNQKHLLLQAYNGIFDVLQDKGLLE